jgi:hypothetical protein
MKIVAASNVEITRPLVRKHAIEKEAYGTSVIEKTISKII